MISSILSLISADKRQSAAQPAVTPSQNEVLTTAVATQILNTVPESTLDSDNDSWVTVELSSEAPSENAQTWIKTEIAFESDSINIESTKERTERKERRERKELRRQKRQQRKQEQALRLEQELQNYQFYCAPQKPNVSQKPVTPPDGLVTAFGFYNLYLSEGSKQ